MLKICDYDEEFLKLSWKWLNDPEIKAMTMAPNFKKSQQKVFFDRLQIKEDYRIYGLTYHGKKIGACGLKNITNKSCEYWGYIGEKEYWGRGIGSILMKEMLNNFVPNYISNIYLKVEINNTRAMSLYKKFDFIIKEKINNYFIMEKIL